MGFKADEHWQVSLATAAEKVEIENKYNPTLSAKVLPEVLSEMFHIIKATLHQGLNNLDKALDPNSLTKKSTTVCNCLQS